MNNPCYILSASQVSCQKPLTDDWMSDPIFYDQDYVRAIEPDSKEFIVPSEARRMSKILKRTICTSITALNKSGIKEPDAIVTGTGMGCMENSEKFLIDLCNFGESCLKPTLFMQSTHNTISSLIAIVLKNHGYNNTYSHKGISFDSALLDAWLQIKTGTIRTALVGSHDEVTPFTALVLEKTHPCFGFVSETSVSAVLSSKSEETKPLCEIEKVELLYKPSTADIINACDINDRTLLMLGVNGKEKNDKPYKEIIGALDCKCPVLNYKHLFGENFSSSAIAVYAAATILHKQMVPAQLIQSGDLSRNDQIDEIVIVNHSDLTSWSVIKLRKI